MRVFDSILACFLEHRNEILVMDCLCFSCSVELRSGFAILEEGSGVESGSLDILQCVLAFLFVLFRNILPV